MRINSDLWLAFNSSLKRNHWLKYRHPHSTIIHGHRVISLVPPMTMTTTSARLLRQSLLRSATRLQSARSMALRSTAASPLLATRASAAAVRAQPWAAQMPIAHFSSDADSQQAEFLDEGRFMDLADGTLHEILDWLDGVEVMLEDSDISFSVGSSVWF